MTKKIVVIGNGIAALSAIEKIRQKDETCSIVVFAQEGFYTYNRLELSKRITEEYPAEEIFVKPESWYQEQGIELHLERAVQRVDLEKKTVTDAKGNEVAFTHLLLAAGGSNFVPPIPGIDLQNVYSLRTLDDAKRIQKSAKGAGRLLLIGGGLLGLEMAWQFKQAGLAITIVEMFPQLMPRQLDLETARYLESVIVGHGVELVLGGGVSKLVGEGALAGYQLKDQDEIRPADLCIYSTGMRSNIGIFKDSGLEMNHGVIVDQGMHTSKATVYAAGDIAEYGGRVYGLWSTARAQGAVAGENITGGEALFAASNPITNIDVFGQVITSVGEVQPEGAIIFKDQSREKVVLKKLFFKDDVLCGGLFVNDQKDVLTVRKALEQGGKVPEVARASYAQVLDFLGQK